MTRGWLASGVPAWPCTSARLQPSPQTALHLAFHRNQYLQWFYLPAGVLGMMMSGLRCSSGPAAVSPAGEERS